MRASRYWLATLCLVVFVACARRSASPRDAGPLPDGAPPPPTDGSSHDLIDAYFMPQPIATSIMVRLVPQTPAGSTRVSFAVPFPRGALSDATQLSVDDGGGGMLPVHLSAIAHHADGSVRSVLVQFEAVVDAEMSVTVQIHADPLPSASTLDAVGVETTLDGSGLPRVWAVLPASWLSESGFAGPMVPIDEVPAGDLQAWGELCNYGSYADTTATDANTWLYDRGTVYVRAYAQTGTIENLRAAYTAVERYRAAITGTGSSTRIGIGSAGDVKYHYTQNMATLYLLNGDARFQSAADDVATRLHDLHRPTYDGSDQFWTERNQGFALIAYVNAMSVAANEETKTRLRGWADAVVDAALHIQSTYPAGYADMEARCYAHDCEAHDPEECADHDTHYWGCSPWMSGILAEGMDAYASEVGGDRAAAVYQSLAQLGKVLGRDAIVPDSDGRPYYWMGTGPGAGAGWDEGYEEHRGEVAYVVALGAARSGDGALRTRALELVGGFARHGEVPHIRSFNWQCRGAVMTPALLR